jgi:hypothetical protein
MSVTEGQKRIVSEIQRVAVELGVKSLSGRLFGQHHELDGG